MKKKTSENIYRTIVENLGVEIFVTDGKGNVLFVNPASIAINELDVDNIVGRNVRELMADGYFGESSTLKVLEEKTTVSLLQHLKHDKKVVATGVPILDEDGEVEMVITTSQDIDVVNELLETLDEQEKEIDLLKRQLQKSSDIDVDDPVSIKVKASMEMVASLDMPILISGESGTGKHEAARYIHYFGKRRDEHFITVNCISADPDFLEQEIFGRESHSEDGKSELVIQGKLDMADGGTLALNNISYMPPKSQSKLFEYINTGEFTRAGGGRPVKSNARIIAMTGMDLKTLSETGMFMKALYYKLNTVPIVIPPLRKRVKDIPYLANQYVVKYNDKYKSKKILNKDALGKLTSHAWPGNLIELDQTIESAYVMTDGPVIKGETIYNVIHGTDEQETTKGSVYCEDIIPLKEAKHQLEEQLTRRAYEVYKTTAKAAEALGVNQSTVSRILSKYDT